MSSDVFISYSRKDTDFTRKLYQVLKSKGFESWVDWEDIPKGTDWLKEIYAGIEAADALILVISPDSMMSEICHQEVAHALANHKRVLPLVRREVNDKQIAGEWFESSWEELARSNWTALRHINWLFFREEDDFDAAVDALIETILTDIDHVKFHTRLTIRAKEWDAGGQKSELLLRGDELQTAQGWIAISQQKDPKPSELQATYIRASVSYHEAAISRERQRQRNLTQARLGIVLAVALIAIIGLLFFAVQSQTASNSAATFEAQAATSDNNARLAEQAEATSVANAATAVIAQGEAQAQAEIAQTQAEIAEENAITATLALAEAEQQANNAQTQAAIAEENAITATLALGEAEEQAGISQTQAAIAENNAVTATLALGEAEQQANNAQTQAAIAENNAVTATLAQGEAQIQAEAAQTQAAIAENNAATADAALDLSERQGTEIAVQVTEVSQAQAEAQRRAEVAQSLAFSAFANGDLNDQLLSLALSMEAATIDDPPTQAYSALFNWALRPGLRTQLRGHEDRLVSAVYSNDGSLGASVDASGVVIVWDMVNLSPMKMFRSADAGYAQNVMFNEDDNTVILVTSTQMIAWDIASEQQVFSFEQSGIFAGDHSPTTDRLILSYCTFYDESGGCTNSELVLWDTSSWTQVATLQNAYPGSIWTIKFDRNGSRIAGGGTLSEVYLWQTEPLQLINTFVEGWADGSDNSQVNAIDFSPTQDQIVIGTGSGNIFVHTLPTGELFRTLRRHKTGLSVTGVSFAPDGLSVLSSAYNIFSGDGEILISDAHTSALLHTLQGHTSSVTSADSSPDGRFAITASWDRTVGLWGINESALGEILSDGEVQERYLYTQGVSPDGRFKAAIAHETGETTIYDNNGEIVTQFPYIQHPDVDTSRLIPGDNPSVSEDSDEIFGYGAAVYNPSLAVIVQNKNLWYSTLTMILDGEPQWSFAENYVIDSMRFSHDGRYLAYSGGTAGFGGEEWSLSGAALIDVETGETVYLFDLHDKRTNVTGIEFSSDDSRVITASGDQLLGVWDVETGELIHVLRGHTEWIRDVAISPDGRWAASASDDNTVILWDLNTGIAIHTFEGRLYWVGAQTVAFGPDGRSLYSGWRSGHVETWNLFTLEELIDWTCENRYIRDFTEDERRTFGITSTDSTCDSTN